MSSIISRSQWGARHQDGYGNRPVGRLEKYLHHTVTSTLPDTATLAQDIAQIRTVESIGQSRFGVGMSYTFLVTPAGRVFQGVSTGRISAHSGAGRNTRGVGICLVGNFDTNKPTSKQVSAVVWLLQEGVRRGWWGDPALTEMHRDFRSTACPGRHAADLFSEINRRGRGTQAESKPAPPASAPKPKPKPTPVPKPKPEPEPRKPVAPSKGRWPDAYLTVVSSHNRYTHAAWVELMRRVGHRNSNLTKNIQTWLRGLGYDAGPSDGVFGPRTTRALQRFLAKRGHYTGRIDGDRGPLTIQGEVKYLNHQAEVIVNL